MATTNAEKKKMGPTDTLTPVFRASYLNAFDATAPDPSKPDVKNFGVEMWFRVAQVCDDRLKDQPVVSIADLEKAAMAACSEAWGAEQGKWPKGFKHPFRKGETLTGKNGTLVGGMVVRTNRKESFGRPVVVDQSVKDIVDKKQVYSGCYMRAKVHAYAWKHPTGGAGVSFTLDMLQLDHDGEPLGNAMKAEDAFEAIPVATAPAGAPAAAAAAPAAGGMFGNLG